MSENYIGNHIPTNNNEEKEATPATSSTTEVIRKKRVYRKKSKSRLKVAKRIPTKDLPIKDRRRTLSQIFLNAFNSCDVKKLESVLRIYAEPDVVSVYRYQGDKNEYCNDYSEIQNTEGILEMWKTLFQSAPDFLFEIIETQAYLDPNIDIPASKVEEKNGNLSELASVDSSHESSHASNQISSKPSQKRMADVYSNACAVVSSKFKFSGNVQQISQKCCACAVL